MYLQNSVADYNLNGRNYDGQLKHKIWSTRFKAKQSKIALMEIIQFNKNELKQKEKKEKKNTG